ncbi:unnamed protein product, partial [Musa acuminata var. zebrina]
YFRIQRDKKRDTLCYSSSSIKCYLYRYAMSRSYDKKSWSPKRRDAVLQAIYKSGILLSFVCDVTPMPHNGCRPPKKRHV